MKPIRADMEPWFKYMAWAGIGFFSLCIVGALRDGVVGPCFAFLFFVGLSALLLSISGPIEADAEVIHWTIPLGRWQMRWDEVTKIEVASTADVMLHGHNKRLALWFVYVYKQPDKKQMIQFIQAQTQARNIELEHVPNLSQMFSKNTKVPRT